jgi:hypothetical protein
MDSSSIIQEIQKIASASVPVTVYTNYDGSIKSIDYQKIWKEGSTKPVEKKTKKGVQIDYVEDYKTIELKSDIVKKIDSYIATLLNV